MANPVLLNGVASPVSIFDVVSGVSNATHPLGTRGVIGDRVFYWTRFLDSTAIGPNKLAQQGAPVANHVTQTGTLTGTDAVRLSAGTLTAVLGATAAAQDEYRGGYLKIQSATTGAGQIWKLRGHDFVASAGTMTVTTPDPTVTATTGTTTWTLLHNPWGNVVIQPTSITAPAAGVTMVNWPAATTASAATTDYLKTGTTTWTLPQYGWLQTWGQASVLADTSNLVAGSGLIVGGTAGTVGVAVETDIKQRIGVATETITTDNIYLSAFLMIAP